MKKIFLISVGVGLSITSLQAQWNYNGNTVPNQQVFLGTLNIAPLRFKTDKLQRMIILPFNGFVGIGVNDPKNPLHVHANDKRPTYDDYEYPGEIIIEEPEIRPGIPEPNICNRSDNGNGNRVTGGSVGSDTTETTRSSGSYSAIQITNCMTGKNTDNGLLLSMEGHTGYLRQSEDANFNISMRHSDVVTVTPGGNVGIGVDPQAKFHVEGKTFLNGDVGIGTNSPYQKLHIVDGNILISKTAAPRAPGSTNGSLLFGADISNAPGQDYYGKWGIEYLNQPGLWGGYGLNFWKPASPGNNFMNYVLFLHDNGNVGIGTNEPQSKLAVDGTICAKEVRVALSGSPCWPDYVFNKEYKLRSLSELEQFIKTNKHLPDVPSAEEVKENGIQLGEMNAILLQKIEELTLYIIKLEKRLTEVEAKKGGE